MARKRAIKPRVRGVRQARAMLEGMGIPVESDPIEVLLQQVYIANGNVAFLLEHVRDQDDPQSPWLRLYNEERDRAAKMAALCEQANVSARRIHLEERQGELIAEFARRLLDHPTLGLTDDQRARGRLIAADQLRALPP